MRVTIRKAADHRRMRWKNGMGETVEIAIHPDGADTDNFIWRVSTATVSEDGPFSVFPEIDRNLSILTGAGLTLDLAGHRTRLDVTSAAFEFPGDRPTMAMLIDGPITDLNVMTRRGMARSWVHRHVVQDQIHLDHKGGCTLIFIAQGEVTQAGHILGPGDCLDIRGGSGGLTLSGHGMVYEIRLLTP